MGQGSSKCRKCKPDRFLFGCTLAQGMLITSILLIILGALLIFLLFYYFWYAGYFQDKEYVKFGFLICITLMIILFLGLLLDFLLLIALIMHLTKYMRFYKTCLVFRAVVLFVVGVVIILRCKGGRRLCWLLEFWAILWAAALGLLIYLICVTCSLVQYMEKHPELDNKCPKRRIKDKSKKREKKEKKRLEKEKKREKKKKEHEGSKKNEKEMEELGKRREKDKGDKATAKAGGGGEPTPGQGGKPKEGGTPKEAAGARSDTTEGGGEETDEEDGKKGGQKGKAESVKSDPKLKKSESNDSEYATADEGTDSQSEAGKGKASKEVAPEVGGSDSRAAIPEGRALEMPFAVPTATVSHASQPETQLRTIEEREAKSTTETYEGDEESMRTKLKRRVSVLEEEDEEGEDVTTREEKKQSIQESSKEKTGSLVESQPMHAKTGETRVDARSLDPESSKDDSRPGRYGRTESGTGKHERVAVGEPSKTSERRRSAATKETTRQPRQTKEGGLRRRSMEKRDARDQTNGTKQREEAGPLSRRESDTEHGRRRGPAPDRREPPYPRPPYHEDMPYYDPLPPSSDYDPRYGPLYDDREGYPLNYDPVPPSFPYYDQPSPPYYYHDPNSPYFYSGYYDRTPPFYDSEWGPDPYYNPPPGSDPDQNRALYDRGWSEYVPETNIPDHARGSAPMQQRSEIQQKETRDENKSQHGEVQPPAIPGTSQAKPQISQYRSQGQQQLSDAIERRRDDYELKRKEKTRSIVPQPSQLQSKSSPIPRKQDQHQQLPALTDLRRDTESKLDKKRPITPQPLQTRTKSVQAETKVDQQQAASTELQRGRQRKADEKRSITPQPSQSRPTSILSPTKQDQLQLPVSPESRRNGERKQDKQSYITPQSSQYRPKSFQPPPKSFQSPPQSFQSPPHSFQSPSRSFQSPPGSFQSPPKSIQSPPLRFQSPPLDQQQPASLELRRDRGRQSDQKRYITPQPSPLRPETSQSPTKGIHQQSLLVQGHPVDEDKVIKRDDEETQPVVRDYDQYALPQNDSDAARIDEPNDTQSENSATQNKPSNERQTNEDGSAPEEDQQQTTDDSRDIQKKDKRQPSPRDD